MKRIKQIGVIGALVFLLAVNVQATDSRKMVLTGTVYHEFTPPGMVITSVDALLNPIYMLDQSNFVNVDYDTPTLTYSGYGFAKLEPFGLPGVIGLQVGKRYGSYRTGIWAGPGQNINDLNGLVSLICGQANVGVDGVNVTDLIGVRSFGLYYALPLGDKLKAGFGFNTIRRSVSGNRINNPQSVSTEMDDTFLKKISATMFRFGAGYALTDRVNLALDFGLGNPKYRYEYTIAAGSTADSETASLSGTDKDANLKVDYKIDDNTALIANVAYLSYGGSLETDPDTATADDGTTFKRTQKSFIFLAGPLFHGDGYNVGFQAGFAKDKSKAEMSLEAAATDTQMDNPRLSYFPILRLFAEKRLLKWFTMRASVTFQTSTEKSKINFDTDPASEDWERVSAQPASALATAFGFTIDMKNGFIIEAYMYDTIFRRAPYIMSGISSGTLNAGVSLGIKL